MAIVSHRSFGKVMW